MVKPSFRNLLRHTSLPILLASLCCVSPIVLVLLGVASVSVASSLAHTLYGEYKWLFRGIGTLALLCSLYRYFTRTRGICTLDAAVQRRNEIINYVALAVIVSVIGYVFFLYVVVHYIGVWYRLW